MPGTNSLDLRLLCLHRRCCCTPAPALARSLVRSLVRSLAQSLTRSPLVLLHNRMQQLKEKSEETASPLRSGWNEKRGSERANG